MVARLLVLRGTGPARRSMTLPFAGVRVLEVASWTLVPAAGAALAWGRT